MSIPYWHDDPYSWNTLILGGQEINAFCKVTCKRKEKQESSSAKGKTSAKLKSHGVEPAEITIEIEIVEKDELDDVSDFLSDIEANWLAGKLKPLDIIHPVTEMRNVNSIKIEAIEGPDEKQAQLWVIKISAKEYRESKDVGSKTEKGSVGSDTENKPGKQPPTVLDLDNDANQEFDSSTAGKVDPPSKDSTAKAPKLWLFSSTKTQQAALMWNLGN